MGVLNSLAPPVRKSLQNPDRVQADILSFVEDLHDISEREIQTPVQRTYSRNRRRRTKSSGSGSSLCYDFREYGIGERRKGSKHRRRTQHLLEIEGLDDDEVFEDGGIFFDDRNTAFTDLFQDEEKMKKWEDFVNLSDEEQSQYVQDITIDKTNKTSNCKVGSNKYFSIDKKLRDTMKNMKPSANDLLKYYEDLMDDMLSPAIVLLSVESPYDRMMVYAVCQYMALASTTIRMASSTVIEVVLEGDWIPPTQTLTNFLRKKT